MRSSTITQYLQKAGKARDLVANKLPGPWATRRTLNARGTGTLNLIDVGSSGGLPEPWRHHADELGFLLTFEPNDDASDSPDQLALDVALWSEDAVRSFYVYGAKGHGSSLYRQNFPWVAENWEWLHLRGPARMAKTWAERSKLVDEMTVTCTTLDKTLLAECPEVDFHVLKIDAQGAELPILEGATDLLASGLLAVQLELFVFPLYEDISLAPNVISFMRDHGFEFAAALDTHGTFDSQHECLFLRDDGSDKAQRIREIYGLGKRPPAPGRPGI